MQIICETTDVTYPLLADVYYPVVEQSGYGNVVKSWTLAKTVACGFAPGGLKAAKDVQVNPSIVVDGLLIGRTRKDLRISDRESLNSITNVILTNIRGKDGVSIYLETTGVRAGKPTIFEIASHEPIVGPFGKTEYYKTVIRRSENQGVTV